MNTNDTRHNHALPGLQFALNVLYVGRFLIGYSNPVQALDEVDEYIEAVTDELVSTELLHEAAVLAGDVLPGPSAGN
ncbi:hypothetical protein [Tellurirhabdus rosea]|uniref:hypothetical protein n=1 Tax=Tellurirhabdus rosea TaxID=2674997 RepID=UPI00224E38D5|nr:hypothetical protein [Tellurirhabdus rosea]